LIHLAGRQPPADLGSTLTGLVLREDDPVAQAEQTSEVRHGVRPATAGPVVKVCGITCVEDAQLAVQLGATALGLVFWPGSPRAIGTERARAIVRDLPPFVAVIGVFVNQPLEAVLEVAASVPLTVVQFHGDEPDDEVLSCPWRVIRAVSIDSPEGRRRLAGLPHRVTVLLDAHDTVRWGGTGRATDWDAAARAAAERRILLAGGLRPENIGEAVSRVRPWGVDVSSGVESAPGVKDPDKLRAFFAALAAGV
jgi:phosphoribosylanthranilate isomerase